MMDSLCRKQKLADLFIPCVNFCLTTTTRMQDMDIENTILQSIDGKFIRRVQKQRRNG